MKKLLLLFLASTLIFTACKKKKKEDEQQLEPKQEQKGFAINYTATWCSSCGSWGAPIIHQYSDDATEGAIICAHFNDPMSSNLSNVFEQDRTTNNGIPGFWVGDNKTSSNGAMTSLLGQGDAMAGVDYKYEIKDGKIEVDAKVKFFEAGQGDYYLSVLVLEDGIPGGTSAPGNYQQAGTNDPNYTHDFVLRASAHAGLPYGESITTNPSADDEVDKSYSIDLDSSWDTDNVYAVCIVWKKDTSNGRPYYKYINALKKKN